MKWVRIRWRLVLLLVVALVAVGFVIWGSTPLGPMPEALDALQSTSGVQVEVGTWFVFRPVDFQPDIGLIFYPGGRVDPRSYAPAAQAIADEGYLVVIVPMPLNLAVLAADRAADVMAVYPEISLWALGGHSLGGAMAARYADMHPDDVAGLVLWASYPAESNDLSDDGLRVASIYGALDGLATLDKIAASRALLPVNTVWVEIPGGNHAQFGWYGSQGGDNPARIDRASQQQQIVEATTALLAVLPERP
ncbi:MAG: alpha/beta fold hydrolase [Anaerolineae bacterium]|nr:alpha/beta fold hydrolase [Anaerolineae bacterium]